MMYQKLNIPVLGLIENMSHFVCPNCLHESDIFGQGGGEAMSLAVRIARSKSKKSKIIFSGYHGWHDWYLAANLQNIKNSKTHKQDQWQTQILCKILTKAKVLIKTNGVSDNELKLCHLEPVSDLQKTIDKIIGGFKENQKVCALPEGPMTIPILKTH